MKWNIDFITQDDFKKHIKQTILHYGDKLKGIDLKQFNKNIIDPVKLIFDKNVYNLSWEDVIKNELSRQRDKSNNNEIGYFHQNMFRYIKNCEVPQVGFDIVYKGKIKIEGMEATSLYVEMKNKHNTMNSSASQKTYMKMQNQLLQDKNCICALVEVIAKHSQNIEWQVSIDYNSVNNKRIRRISIDKFYEIITGDKDAFFKICSILPNTIQEIMQDVEFTKNKKDSVFEELSEISKKVGSFELALYLLGFNEYNGFNNN